MKEWACTFCGAEANAACGEYFWCDACQWKFEYSTCEPNLRPPLLSPSPAQQLLGWIQYQGFTAAGRLVPIRWLYDGTRGWRLSLATWTHGGAYWSYSRWRGWV